jgi:hypothetical protein
MILGGRNHCKIVGFEVLALAKGGRVSHFLVETPANLKGELMWRNLGGESEADDRRTQIGSDLFRVQNAFYSHKL